MGNIQVNIEDGVHMIETAGRSPKDEMVSAIKCNQHCQNRPPVVTGGRVAV